MIDLAQCLMAQSFGSMYISTSAPTSITGPGTQDKIAGTTTAGALNLFTMSANNRLQYTGMMQVDVTRMKRVFLNLAFNARDAMPAGGT